MFMTSQSFAQRVPPTIAPNGENFWRAISVCLRSSWYVLTYRHREDGSEFIETMVISWESTLLEVIESLGKASILSVCCMAPASDGRPGWAMKRARELLLPAEDERRETGPLLFALEGEEGVFDSHQTKVMSRSTGRTVLLTMARSAAR